MSDTEDTEDTSNDLPGQRIDAAVAELQAAWADLGPKLQAKRQELGDAVTNLVDNFQARVDALGRD